MDSSDLAPSSTGFFENNDKSGKNVKYVLMKRWPRNISMKKD